MTNGNLKLLDMDEHLRNVHTIQNKELLDFCKRYDLTLDLASSDVVMFLEDTHGNSVCIG